MQQTEVGRVIVGREYDYQGLCLDCANGRAATRYGGRYRVHALATQAVTGQECVVYEGLSGPDAGRWFTCPPYDFAAKFQPVAQPTAEKAAGHVSESIHS